MFGRNKPEVLVVGAGPTGLCAALALAKRRIRVQIIEKASRTGAHSYALALHAQSLRIFEKFGLLAPVLEKGIKISHIGVYEGATRKAEIRLRQDGADAASLVVLPQNTLEALLEGVLRDCGVSVLWNHELSQLALQSDKVVATINTLEQESMGYAVARSEWVVAKSTTLEVPFVIGADGHRSRVRRSLGIEFPEIAPAQQYAVFEFQSDLDLRDEVRIVLGKTTTDVLWPLPGRSFRWSFELAENGTPQVIQMNNHPALAIDGAAYPLLSDDGLRKLIAERAPWFTGSIEASDWRIAVRFEHRLANTFSKDRVALAGDAAHLTGPIGVQSMNAGLAEANDLAGVVAESLHYGELHPCLESYGQHSLARWRHLGQVGSLQCSATTDPWICERRDRILPCLPASGPDLPPLAKQLGLEAA
jgi:2-polyprenyl-6-methoxyphenol hydroxylase-like FAD-dependent oxidoreductase